MELIIRHFSELSTTELYEIYKLRVAVFVVEQNCPYQEVDHADQASYHVWLQDEDGIQAYARVLPPGEVFPEAAIGRVIAVKRRCGMGSEIVKAAIQVAKSRFSAETITIEARPMPGISMKNWDLNRFRKNFWKMRFHISRCS